MGFLDTNEVRTRYTATDETTAVTKRVQGGLDDMVKMAARAAVAYVGVRQAVQAFRDVLGNAREIQAFSTRLGVSVESLQRMKFAAEQSNVSFTQMATSIQRSTRRIAEAAVGIGVAVGPLKELGLEAGALSALDPSKQFDRLAAALQGVTDQGKRLRLAVNLFDQEGASMLQLIDKAGPSLAEMGRQFDKITGGPLSAAEVKKLDDYAKGLGRVGTALDAVKESAVLAFIDGAGGVDQFTESVSAARPGVAILTRALSELAFGGTVGKWAEEATRAMNRFLVESLRVAGETKGLMQRFDVGQLPEPTMSRRNASRGSVAPPAPPARLPVDTRGALESRIAALPPIRDVGPKLEGDWEKTILHGWQRVGEAQDKQVAQLEAITEQVGGVEGAYNDVGESVRTATDRTMEWAIASRQQAEELGATMVDVAFAFADDWATVMAQATFGVMSFAEAAKQAFRSLAIAAVAELNKIIARAIVLATLKAILGFGDGGLVGKASSSGGSGGVGTQVGGGKVVMAAGGTVRAAGGWNVPGYGGGDIVQALLEPGEGVINKQAVRAIGGPSAITRMNLASGLPSMSSAGPGGSSQRRNVNLSVSISTVMGSRGEAMAVANAFVQYAKASGALA